jgi:DNA replication protein DnaC
VKTKIFELMEKLKLRGMMETLEESFWRAEKEGFSHADLFYELLAAEYIYQENRSRTNRIKRAELPFEWTLETFPFSQQPSVNKTQILNLAGLDFVKRRDNLVFIGDTGTGKSGLATGILQKALANGMNCRFYNAQKLMDDLYASLADRTTSSLLKKLANYDILLIDELGYLTLKDEQCNAFFKLISDRYEKKSTIITTNLDYPEWSSLFRRKPLTEAMVDRVRHHCITIRTEGQTLRTPGVSA